MVLIDMYPTVLPQTTPVFACHTVFYRYNIWCRRCCRTLGTPTEEMWPGVSELPDYKTCFPNWRPGNQLEEAVPELSPLGLDLIKVIVALVGQLPGIISSSHCKLLLRLHNSSIKLLSTYSCTFCKLFTRWLRRYVWGNDLILDLATVMSSSLLSLWFSKANNFMLNFTILFVVNKLVF